MFIQLVYGTLIMIGTIIIQAGFIGISSWMLTLRGNWFVKPPTALKLVFALIILVLWLTTGLSISAWLWAIVFLAQGAFDSLEAALYSAVVTFTTLGYGDITLPKEWRLMGSLAAVNGLIVIALNTAYLVEAISRIRQAQERFND